MDKIAANEHAQSPQPTRKNGSGECMIGREGAERGLGVAEEGGGTRSRWMLGTGLGRDTRGRELVEWGERRSKGGRSRGEGGQM
jgi:hypothetical protein